MTNLLAKTARIEMDSDLAEYASHPVVEAPATRLSDSHLGSIFTVVHEPDRVAEPPLADPAAGALKISAYANVVTPIPIMAADAVGFSIAGMTALLACHFMNGSGPREINWLHSTALLPVIVFTYWCAGLYPGVGVHPVTELRTLSKLNTIAFLAAVAALRIAGASPSWDLFFSIIWIMTGVAVPLLRTFARHKSAHHAWWGFPTVVISSGNAAGETIKTLLRRPHSGLRPCGVIDPTGQATGSVRGIPFITEITRPPTGLYAVVALPDISREALMQIVDVYRDRFSHLLILSSRSGMPTLLRDDRHYGGSLAGTELGNKLLLPWHCRIKRAIDVGLVAIAAPIWLPLVAILAAAVRITSGKCVFYGQRRLGKNGNSFIAWKLRTMRRDSDEILKKVLETDPQARQEWEQDHKLKNDPRVTRLGKFLRKSSLDEIPQLWNVLMGEMSLVGPRPIVNDEVAKYGKIYRLYSQVPPGITGLWQISGRNNTTYEERVLLDDFYVRNWSPWLDVYVLARTVYTILRRDGAY
jgi:Undecaprenyl-phosphate galactose phosphotransferase WbaP